MVLSPVVLTTKPQDAQNIGAFGGIHWVRVTHCRHLMCHRCTHEVLSTISDTNYVLSQQLHNMRVYCQVVAPLGSVISCIVWGPKFTPECNCIQR